MPVANSISHVAGTFHQNAQILAKSYDGLTGEEWMRRPNDSTNSFLWIMGHIVWARSRTIACLGSSWTRPWLPLFARGATPAEPAQYPSPEEVVLAWKEVSESLDVAMENVTEEALAAPAPPKSPSLDGNISGMVDFLSFHETYHVGQTAYLRRWLGHGRVTG